MSLKYRPMSDEDFALSVAAITRSLVFSTTEIQKAAVSVLCHSLTSDTVTQQQKAVAKANTLYDTLGTESRKDSLLAYFEKYGNLVFSKVDKKVVYFDREQVLGADKKIVWTDDYAEKVTTIKWNEVKKPPTPKSIYDCEVEVRKFVDSMDKQVKLGTATNIGFYNAVKEAFNAESSQMEDAMFTGMAIRALASKTDNETIVKLLIGRGCKAARAADIVNEFAFEDAKA